MRLELIVALLLAVAVLPADAATDLTFVSPVAEITCDEAVWIDIVVDGGAIDLRGLTLNFFTDPARLDILDFAPGTLFVDAPCDPFLFGIELGPGVAQIDVAGLGCSVDGPGSVARVLVQGLADGIAPLNGVDATLRDSTNAPIGAAWVDVVVPVLCPVSDAAIGWSTVKRRFR